MPNRDQLQQIHDLLLQGQTNEQIAAAVGLELGDVESVRATAAFLAENSPVTTPPSGLRHVTFDFAHDTPGLLTGVTAYTLKEGESILSAWPSISVAWDGTSPKGAVGPAAGLALANAVMNSWDMKQADLVFGHALVPQLAWSWPAWPGIGSVVAQGGDEPLKLVVSQDGTPGAADPGSTQGKATLHLLVLA